MTHAGGKTGGWLQRRLPAVVAGADYHDLAALALLVAFLLLVALTFPSYAISNDEAAQQRYGELIINYYASGFTDQALFHFNNLYLYGGLFDIIAVGLEKIVPLDPYAVRHLLSALIGVGGIVATWGTARTIGGPRAGLLAAAALAVCGIWYGAMFNHTKDIPFASAMIGALYVLLRAGRELPRPRWRLVVMFGILCGCALGLRVLGLFLIGYAGIIVAAAAVPIAAKGCWGRSFAFIGRCALVLAPAFGIAYAIMAVSWPWSVLAPLNPLRAIYLFANFNYPIYTVLDGHVYEMADVPRWYVPEYLAIKLTLPLLGGACLALLFAMLPQRSLPVAGGDRRRELLLVALAALLPLICNALVHGPGFTGMRQFLFTMPPIAVLAGLGLDSMLDRLRWIGRPAAAAGLLIVVAGFGWDAASLYRLHPDEYLYFNPLVGGLQGASRRYATDYWVNIMPEAVHDLERFLDRTERSSGRASTERFAVGVCGDRLSFEDAADGRLQWTPDWKHADFFIAPTHMNCDRALDGRTIAKVERLGVVIGVIKDRRAVTRVSVANKDASPQHPPGQAGKAVQ